MFKKLSAFLKKFFHILGRMYNKAHRFRMKYFYYSAYFHFRDFDDD